MKTSMYLLHKVMKLLHFLVIFAHEKMSNCSRHKDSQSCTNHYTWINEACRWCPLDQICHSKCSTTNTCISETVNQEAQCKENNSGNFCYDVNEAYKLAQFSAIAYSDEPKKCLKAIFPRSDYSLFYVYLKECDDYLFSYEKQCLAFATFSHRNQEIIIAYRGTRGVKQIIDQVLTSIGTPYKRSAVGGKVERYFNNVHHKFYYNIKHMIRDLIQWFPKYTVKLTGHSLGGAVASISSAMLIKDKILKPEQLLLYTFGMPRVGNKLYASAHDRLVPNSWRVVREGDAVARLPSCTLALCTLFSEPHHHGTKVMYSGSKMDIQSKYIICDGNKDTTSKCKEKRGRKRRGAIKSMIKKHKVYFDIPIGTYCRDHILKQK